MRTKRANIDDFLHRTKADLLSGYRKEVDFIESTAGELHIFNQVLQKENLRKYLILDNKELNFTVYFYNSHNIFI